jgi:hypothetical protein
MDLQTQPAWGLNNQEEIIVKLGTGGSNVVGTLPLNQVPVDATGKLVLRIPELDAMGVSTGFFDYNDSATAITPISVLANTWTKLTNNGLGAFTNKTYKPTGVAEVWNTTTNRFEWGELLLGDAVDIRADIEVITSVPNQTVSLAIFNATGTGGEYEIDLMPETTYKTTGIQKIITYMGIYMGDNNTLNNPSEIRIRSDAACSVKVNGWYVRLLLVGQH